MSMDTINRSEAPSAWSPLAIAIMEEEARTGQRSKLRDRPDAPDVPTPLDPIEVTPEDNGTPKPIPLPPPEPPGSPDVLAPLEGNRTSIESSTGVKRNVAEDFRRAAEHPQDDAKALRDLATYTRPNTNMPAHEQEDLRAELEDLLQPDVKEHNAGTEPIWPPSSTVTAADILKMPPEQRPRNLAEAVATARGIDPNQAKERADTILDPVRQFTSKAIGSTLATPYTALAGVTAIPSLVGLGDGQLSGSFLEDARNVQQGTDKFFGAREASTDPFAQLAAEAGSSVVPAGKFTAPLTAANLAVRLGADYLSSPAEAKTKKQPPIGVTNPELIAPGDAVVHGLPPNISPSQLIDQHNGVTHTVETVAGPTQIKATDLAQVGVIGAVTMGSILAPWLLGKLKGPSLPKFRPVTNAAPGTEAISNLVDYARTFDDANAGALRVFRRAGLDPIALKKVDETFQINTRATAQSLANSAVEEGRLEVPGFMFKVSTPLSKLAQSMTPPAVQYLHTMNILDEILVREGRTAFSRSPKVVAAGPATVRGMTSGDAINLIASMEAADPELRVIGQQYRENLNELRRFQSTGEYATMSPAARRKLNTERKNFVPGQITEDPNYVFSNPIEALSDMMRKSIRARLENELKGLVTTEVRKIAPSMFRPVTIEKEKNKPGNKGLPNLTKNPNWRDNVVKVRVRGRDRYFTTDPYIADVFRMDPYYYKNMVQQVMYMSKRGFEMNTTGGLAPWFAVTSMQRNWLISKITTPEGYKSPSYAGTLYAIPQQILPQLAGKIAETLDAASAGWLGNVFGKQNIDGMSRWLAQAHANSLMSHMLSMGTHKNSIMEMQDLAQSKLAAAIQNAKGFHGALLKGYGATLSAVHNAPAFAFVSQNRKVRTGYNQSSLVELAREARNLTGNPQTAGSYFTAENKAIRFDPGADANLFRRMQVGAVRGYGAMNELGREAVPWFNQTQQGAKRLGQAYLDNPSKFVGRMWTYMMAPAAGGYLYAYSLDKDPNGVSYVDHMMNRRSEYAKSMFFYIPIPGRPAEEGIEWPRFHEGSIFARMMESSLDHMLHNNVNSNADDIQKAAASFLDVAVVPPTPPIINTVLSLGGVVGPQNLIGGNTAYTRKTDPFDQTGGLPGNLELIIRNIAPGIGEIGAAGLAAFKQTPDGLTNAFSNLAAEMGKRAIIKTPMVRDFFNIHSPMSGNTDVVAEAYKKDKAIKQITNFFRSHEEGGQLNQINMGKLRSKAGTAIVRNAIPDQLPSTTPGLDQPPPTNPLYKQFVELVNERTRKDDPKSGGVGVLSMWSEYSHVTQALRSMRNINTGNYVTWKKRMEGKSDLMEYLDKAGINTDNPIAVRNYYERRRQDVARTILFTLRAVEDEMTKKLAISDPATLKGLGGSVKFEDLDPYKNPTVTESNTFDPYAEAPP